VNATGHLRDPLLDEIGVAHGFGMRGASTPEAVVRPRQVHGIAVAQLDESMALTHAEADAVVSRVPGVPVAVVTADCVPILVASESGRAVAAIHAGWRGIAGGVVATAVGRLVEIAAEPLVAAIGPHIRPCCYEVDAPVIDAMKGRFGESTHSALSPSRPGHERIDLQRLITLDLARAGVPSARTGTATALCTACDADRFESYRRDGARAGRMVHWVAAVSVSA